MKVVGYVRISRAMEDSTSIAKQREVLESTARARGWTLVGTEVDEDVSATKSRLDREGLTSARARIARGEADALLCWRLDRVARSVVDMGALLDEGLQVISATEPLDTTTPMGRAMVEILQVFAALESATTGERLKATKAFLKSQRRWSGGPRPYGYRPVKATDGIGKVLEVVPEEAAVVRRIHADLLAGVSVNGLARALNAEGIPTSTGGTWKAPSVLNLARALHVSGFLTEAVLDGHGKPTRERRPVLGEDCSPVRAWEPLVDDDVAAQVRALFTREARDAARSAATKAGLEAPKRLLEGLVVCPCGERLIRRNRRGVAFYGCRGLGEGSHVLVDAEKTEEEAARQFLQSFSGVEVVERLVNVSVTAALAEVDVALTAATAGITRTGTADLPALFARIADLTAERERLQKSDRQVITKRTFTAYGDAWASWTDDEKRAHMADLGVTVTVRPAKRRGTWDPARVRLDAEVDYLVGQIADGDSPDRATLARPERQDLEEAAA
ncbi:recombinase family protein [Nocardioides sp. GXZ039]|uniref:recombinase family protein n=1 Tax=Nocardioides sp. GXZ039 TaxID=3136018 RepID=UPI0030F3FB7D